MHRVLFHIGPVHIYSWGVMVAGGFLLGLWASLRRAKKFNIPQKDIVDLSVYIVLFSIIGSRALHVITNWSEFSKNPIDVINPFQGGQFGISGMSMLGGVISAIITGVIFAVIRKINFFRLADTISPTFLLGMFVGRWGCFLNGCCFGVESHLPWAVKFPPNCPAGNVYPDIPVHPTQIYESLLDLILYFVLVHIERRKKRHIGWATGLTFVFYGCGRAIVDYFRWYEPQEVAVKYLSGNISIHGILALGLAIVGILYFFITKKLSKM